MIKITAENKYEYIPQVKELLEEGRGITNALNSLNIDRSSWYKALTTNEKLELEQLNMDAKDLKKKRDLLSKTNNEEDEWL